MNKVAHYLQEHVVGEVYASHDVREHFSTDASIFKQAPAIVVYPRSENDVRKAVRFSWQLAERGRVIPITARGSGTDLTGAAIGSGIMLVFPAHMHKILELDPKNGLVAVQPGANFGKLQQTLFTHGRFLPSFPASGEYSTIGGAVANNASGSKSYKYSDTLEYVRGLRVVLANGELIETGKLNKRELKAKLGLSGMEGEIYRQLDSLLEEYKETIKNYSPQAKTNIGYNVSAVRSKDGSFNLTPLLVGSQGSLGVITEVVLDTETHNPETSLVMAGFDSIEACLQAIDEIKKMKFGPSELDFVDRNLLEFALATNPHVLKGYFNEAMPDILLFAEFDDESIRLQRKVVKKFNKIIEKYGQIVLESKQEEYIDRVRAVRDTAAGLLSHSESSYRAVPVIDDAAVPPEKLGALIGEIRALMQRYNQKQYGIWGHAGSSIVHAAPFLDLSLVGDRQKVFKMLKEYYEIVMKLGGSLSGEHGDGRLRGHLLPMQLDSSMMELCTKVKKIFDPHGIFNPGVKFDATEEQSKAWMRNEYSIRKFADHMPRS